MLLLLIGMGPAFAADAPALVLSHAWSWWRPERRSVRRRPDLPMVVYY